MSGTLTKYLPSKRSPQRCLPRSRETALDLGKALILNKEKQFCHLWLPDTSTGTSTACYTFKTKECTCIYIYNIYIQTQRTLYLNKKKHEQQVICCWLACVHPWLTQSRIILLLGSAAPGWQLLKALTCALHSLVRDRLYCSTVGIHTILASAQLLVNDRTTSPTGILHWRCSCWHCSKRNLLHSKWMWGFTHSLKALKSTV